MLSDAFTQGMSRVCAPVAVVTLCDQGAMHGTTVSAFCSLSLDPPMLLVSLDHASRLMALLHPGSVFGLNVLAAHQEDIARRFASKADDKFHDVDRDPHAGAPRLSGSLAWFLCEIDNIVPGGDHFIVLGRVLEAESTGTDPLVYWDRSFGTRAGSMGVSADYAQ